MARPGKARPGEVRLGKARTIITGGDQNMITDYFWMKKNYLGVIAGFLLEYIVVAYVLVF